MAVYAEFTVADERFCFHLPDRYKTLRLRRCLRWADTVIAPIAKPETRAGSAFMALVTPRI